MSSEKVALVRSIIDAWNERGEALLHAYHEDAEWDFRGWGFDLRGTFRGMDGLAAMLEGVHREWEDVRVEPEHYAEAGDKVAFFGRFYARRRGGSGIDVSDAGTCVFTVRDGKVSRFALLRDREEALAMLELDERALRSEPART